MSEVAEKIEECISELRTYEYVSPEAEYGIKRLKKLKEQLVNLTDQNIGDILREITQAYEEAKIYSSYIPKTIDNLRFIKEYLKSKRRSSPL